MLGLSRQWMAQSALAMSTYPGAPSPASAAAVADAAASGKRLRIKALHEAQEQFLGKEVTIKAWVRTVRTQKGICFVELNDGSSLKSLQVVVDQAAQPHAFEVAAGLTTGSAVQVLGKVVASPAQGQQHELSATNVTIVGTYPADTYPLQKKRHSLEFLRSLAHLRPRTNTIAAVSRVRSELAYATHKFFQDQGFLYLQTPIITGSDCEGAGAMFRVTTLPGDIKALPKASPSSTAIDYSQDFFKRPAYLTVSGQLNAEAYACAMGDVYTFGPTFRAENSQTTRHLAEFNMIEPEMAFADLSDNMDNAEAFVKYVIQHVLDRCANDLEFFQSFYDKGLLERLQRVVSKPFVRIPYSEAVELLKAEISKDPSKWAFPDMHFGVDLQTEHEKWLAGTKFDSPVFVYNYPREIKSFYMRDNECVKCVCRCN
jgi:asparaginyl-tRNA synthetase